MTPTKEELIKVATPLLQALLATGEFIAPDNKGDMSIILSKDRNRFPAVDLAVSIASILIGRAGLESERLAKRYQERKAAADPSLNKAAI